eukprot:scaffold37497_cov20-Tisochrysis_lutea.AAC.1
MGIDPQPGSLAAPLAGLCQPHNEYPLLWKQHNKSHYFASQNIEKRPQNWLECNKWLTYIPRLWLIACW